MSASELERVGWLEPVFWDRLDRLESHHRRIVSEHESAQRELARSETLAAGELREVWQRYCAVIAELDRATGEIETLRTCAS
jgi:uncharacterized protein YifE (UPF0438 family)